MNPSRDEISRDFDALRTDDAAHAPSFDAVWSRAQARGRELDRLAPSRRWWLAAAAIVGIAVAVGAYRVARSPSDQDLAESVSRLMRATPATDGLLRMSRPSLIAPGILTSVLDGAGSGASRSTSSTGD